MRDYLILAGGLVGGLLIGAQAFAQPGCGPRDEWVAPLMEDYAEGPMWRGIGADGAMYEVWGNPVANEMTWTLVRTDPAGVACTIMHGFAGEAIPYVATGAPA